MVLNNFIKAACLSTCLGLASGSILANTYNVESNGGLNVYDANDSDHWFSLKGKMQVDQSFFHAGTNVEGSAHLRAVQAEVKGGIGQNLSYSFRLKRDGNAVSMDKSQVSYSGFNSWSKVSVGQVSMPYGLNSSFTEDSVATSVFSPNAGKDSLGIAVTAWNDRVGLSCSIHQPDANKQVNGINSFNTAARISFAPLMRDNLIVHVGLNAYYLQDRKMQATYNLAKNSQATAITVVKSEDNAARRGFGLDTAVLRGPLFMQAELHTVSYLVSKSHQSMGYNVEASYALTGESRNYDRIAGSFSNIKTDRDSGSWQVSARHSFVRNIAEKTTVDTKTLGASVAWTVNNNLTLFANYENALQDSNEGALSLRLQAAW